MRYTEAELDDYLKLALTLASALKLIRQLDDAASNSLIAVSYTHLTLPTKA